MSSFIHHHGRAFALYLHHLPRRQAHLHTSLKATMSSLHLQPAATAASNTSSSSTVTRCSASTDEVRASKPPTPTPPCSTSAYRWRFLASPSPLWWRPVDPMSNFILHWNQRFHGHGDMFATLLLTSSSSLNITGTDLREAMRRIRFSHPTIAVRLAKRSEVGIAERVDMPKVLQGKVDLQFALVCDVLLGENEVQAWLDETVVIHNAEDAAFERFVAARTARGSGSPSGLRVHFWPSTSRITLEQSHSVSEGVGTLLTFHHLVSALASVLSCRSSSAGTFDWGSEVVRLEPALQDALANPPASWQVTKQELREVRKVNAERMNGKSSPPNLFDQLAGKVVNATLANASSNNVFRSKILNKPLVRICRRVAKKGDMLPLGLLPQPGKAAKAQDVTHTAMLTRTISREQTGKLLLVIKEQGLTLAPFLEAVSHMCTAWIRRHRHLSPSKDGWDHPNRILGSFSNAISKRDTLLPEYSGYLGLCMSGFPTKISASSATWSPSSLASSTHPTATKNPMPTISQTDIQTLFTISHSLADQYRQGREKKDWFKYDQALMFETMTTEHLFLKRNEWYPSHPWLSSIGKIDSILHPNHTLLQVKNVQLVGRVGIRQPILHVYTFNGETTLQLSYADWHYPNPTKNATEDKEGETNVLEHWLQVYRSLIDAVASSA